MNDADRRALGTCEGPLAPVLRGCFTASAVGDGRPWGSAETGRCFQAVHEVGRLGIRSKCVDCGKRVETSLVGSSISELKGNMNGN